MRKKRPIVNMAEQYRLASEAQAQAAEQTEQLANEEATAR